MYPFQQLLSENKLTAHLMRFLAYIKNDILGTKIEGFLIKQMIPQWKEMQILDLGSGPCQKLKDRRFRGVDITCFDIFQPYLSVCQRLGFKTVHGDARKLNYYFKSKSFDIVLLIDVLEHFTKMEGDKVLSRVEKIARKQIIIWTPVGWYPHDYDCVDDAWKAFGNLRTQQKNKYQQHQSSWHPDDLEKKGYTCTVLKDYHFDIRSVSHDLQHHPTPVHASQMWAIKLFDEKV
ncbi:MAG: class I SAM-dependent methyltransferase [Candidatus Levybacteria bacterium]|nr:class I SAM-dependent methyltransferase [Candidatus Levybacteria bacterium]